MATGVVEIEFRGAELDPDRIPQGSIRKAAEELLSALSGAAQESIAAPNERPKKPARATRGAPKPRKKRGRHHAPACRSGGNGHRR